MRVAAIETEAEAEAERNPWKDRLAIFNMRSIEWLGMHVPRPAGLRVASVAFAALHRAQRDGQREVVAQNLSRVLGYPPGSPLVRRAVWEAYQLYGRYWYETYAMRSMSAEEVNRRFSIDGVGHIDRALEAGRGIICALPHMGNWDAAGHWLCLNGYRMSAVAEELKPKEVFELFLKHRRALGMGIVPLSEGRNVGAELVRLLSENEVITLVADRDLTDRGVEVEMFGEPRQLPAGPAYLSLATGSPLSPSAVYTTPEGWHTIIEPPLQIERSGSMREDVSALTRLLAARFERLISAAPTDWHMFQPAWPDERPPA